MRDWDLPEKRLKGTTILLKNLVTIAEAKSKAA
jgi:hypothetical protein